MVLEDPSSNHSLLSSKNSYYFLTNNYALNSGVSQQRTKLKLLATMNKSFSIYSNAIDVVIYSSIAIQKVLTTEIIGIGKNKIELVLSVAPLQSTFFRCKLENTLNYTITDKIVYGTEKKVSCLFDDYIYPGAYDVSVAYNGQEYVVASTKVNVLSIPAASYYTKVSGSDPKYFGAYLRGASLNQRSFLCYFALRSSLTGTRIKAITPTSSNSSSLFCEFSDFLLYYQEDRNFTLDGLTDLKEYFYNQLIDYNSPVLHSTFIKLFMLSVSPQITHINTIIEVKVLFSALGRTVYAQITHAVDGFSLTSDSACTLTNTSVYSCAIPSTVTKFGNYILRLVDQNSYALNDNHLLRLAVIARPVPVSVEPLQTSIQGTGRRFLKVTLNSAVTVNVMNSTYCFVGPNKSKVRGFFKSLTEILCDVTGKQHATPPLCVEISLNGGHDITSACAATVSTYRLPLVYNITPSYMSIDRYNSFYISGTKMLSLFEYSCALKKSDEIDFVSIGVVVNDSCVRCDSNLSRFNQTYTGHMLFYADSILLFNSSVSFIKDVIISTLSPNCGPDIGNTTVAITLLESLSPLEGDVQWQCRFSRQLNASSGVVKIVNATVVNTTSVTCVSPNVNSDIQYSGDTYVPYYVAVSQHDTTFQSSTAKFYFYPSPQVVNLFPSEGYITEDNLIKVIGTNFLNWKSLRAKVKWSDGENIVEPLFLDSESLILHVPVGTYLSTNLTDNLTIQISNNAIDYSSSSQNYTYRITPNLLTLTPSSGSNKGGSTVQVIGYRFNNEVKWCKFGEVLVDATYVNTHLLTCVSPTPLSNSTTTVNFTIIFEPNIEIAQNALSFEYLDQTLISSFTPTEYHISGGITVIIIGNFSSLLSYSSVKAYFGTEASSNTTIVNSTHIYAVLPAVSEEKSVSVSIVANNAEYTNEFLFFPV